MIIRILRHGETEYNKSFRYQGWKDIPLSEEGRKKLFSAKQLPDRVYVSGLQRTRQTAEILFPGAEYREVPELNEMNFGSFEGRTWAEMRDEPEYRSWMASKGMGRCPGGEDRKEFTERIRKALIALVKKEEAEGRDAITIVAHGGTIMASMEEFCTDRPGEYREWLTGNGEGYAVKCSTDGSGMQWHVIRRLSYVRNSGRVHLYYGEGRGKTSIATGTALRALARGYEVTVLHFCKQEGSGEAKQLEKAGATVFYGKKEKGFVSSMNYEEKAKLKEEQTALLKDIKDGLQGTKDVPGRLVVLDEVCAALEQEVLDRDVLWEMLFRRPSGVELILTGRHPEAWLLAAADYATELKSVRHPYEDGLMAREGVDF